MEKETFNLEGKPFIELYKLFKVLGWCSSGGEAKALIAAGLVNVDGEPELRKRGKIKPGQLVEFEARSVKITEQNDNASLSLP